MSNSTFTFKGLILDKFNSTIMYSTDGMTVGLYNWYEKNGVMNLITLIETVSMDPHAVAGEIIALGKKRNWF